MRFRLDPLLISIRDAQVALMQLRGARENPTHAGPINRNYPTMTNAQTSLN
jgi:hypothetical protein